MKLYQPIMVTLVLLLSGCHNADYHDDGDTGESVVPVAPEAPQAAPVVTHNLLRSSYRIRAHFPMPGGANYFVAGTGTAIDAHHIVTVAHVVCAAVYRHPEILADFIRADVFDDNAEYDHSIVCHIVKIDVHHDLAELSTEDDLPFFHTLNYGVFTPHADVYNIGAAHGGIPFQIFHGRLTKKAVELDALDGQGEVTLFEASYAVAGGTSGGGCYTYDGHFIGIIDRGGEDSTWFIRADDVKTFLQDTK